MGQLAISVFINRSQQDVFDFLSDPANLSKWSSAFESAEWTSNDTPGIGSTYRVSANLFGSRKEGLFEIVQWDCPNCYSYKMNARAFPIERMESTITLRPKNDGTQVNFESQFELVSALKFAEGFFAKVGEKQDGKNFNVAKGLLEAG
ncbi:MAG: SRPBCC family protein [Anaerolineae bacterium]|nr:SRPBCC family protein [Anaerolineae bacterium]